MKEFKINTENLTNIITQLKNREIDVKNFNQQMMIICSVLLLQKETFDFYLPINELTLDYHDNFQKDWKQKFWKLNSNSNIENSLPSNSEGSFNKSNDASEYNELGSLSNITINSFNTSASIFFPENQSNSELISFSQSPFENPQHAQSKEVDYSDLVDALDKYEENYESSGISTSISKLSRKKENKLNAPPLDLNKKNTKKYTTTMNLKYITLVYYHYAKIYSESINEMTLLEPLDNSEGSNKIDKFLFVKLFKKFILSCGISHKKIYDECVRNILYLKKDITLEEFIPTLDPILSPGSSNSIIKYKFLLMILSRTVSTDSYITNTDIKTYYDLIKCPKVYESVSDTIASSLVKRYKEMFYVFHEGENIRKGYYKVSNILLVLESLL